MKHYFVSYSYLSPGGQPLFGHSDISSERDILSIDDVLEIRKNLTTNEIRNVAILNIQKFPI